MTLPEQFKNENTQQIYIYHYVEELIANFQEYMENNTQTNDITRAEFPVLIRIRFSNNTTQKEIVNLLNLSDGYTAKLLRKFEIEGYIIRKEDSKNRRRKIVTLTPKGIQKTDELIRIIDKWEQKISQKITPKELETLKTILFKLLI